LRRLANALQAGTRGIDTVARIGGEEFALVLPETDSVRGCEVAERLRQEISALDTPPAGRITVSIGLAECTVASGDVRELFNIADAALYEAKHAGRDRVQCAPLTNEANPASALGVT
jgi:diguanylate cyclase (GGDEF)-like protein